MSRLIERLGKFKEDRGMMANLRCILVDNKKHRAWPVLNRLRIPINDDVLSFIAGLYATHPEPIEKENFGATCRRIQRIRDESPGNDGKLTPTERRFQHLLSAADRIELKDRLRRIVLMAKAHGVQVNYTQLTIDIRYWNDRTRNEWASAFWDLSSLPSEKEDL